MGGMIETDFYSESDEMLTTKYSEDVSGILDANRADRNAIPETGKYKGNLVHALRLSETDVIRLKLMGYNLLSPDKDEVRRALVYIQQNEPHHLVVNGKPFARKRNKWA